MLFLLCCLLLTGLTTLLTAQTTAPDDAWFLNWLEKWNRAFSPVDTALIAAMLPDDFQYAWSNQTDAPLAFGEITSKAEFMKSVVIEDQGWQVLEYKKVGNYPGEVDNTVRRSSDGKTVWLHNHEKDIYKYKDFGKEKIDSALISACYTFQQRGSTWQPVHAFVSYYLVKKTRRFGGLYQELNVSAQQGKKFRLTAAVRTDFREDGGFAYLWARVNREDGSPGFFHNTWETPRTPKDWDLFSIEGMIDEDAEKLTVGCGVMVPGIAWFDGFQLSVETQPGVWMEVPLSNGDFEDASWNGKYPMGWQGTSIDFVNFTNDFTEQSPFQGKRAFKITGLPERF